MAVFGLPRRTSVAVRLQEQIRCNGFGRLLTKQGLPADTRRYTAPHLLHGSARALFRILALDEARYEANAFFER
jgi:hypothetical protein